MKISIHQPSYFPWLGLLDKIAKSNLYILLDDVQLTDSACQHRNIFLTNNGKTKYLTIGIHKRGYLKKTIKDICLTGEEWQKKHRDFLKNNYGKHPFFNEIFESIEYIFSKKYKFLIDVLVDSMLTSFRLFDIKPNLRLQSETEHDRQAKKSDLVLSLLMSVNAVTYISGTGAREYLNFQDFEKNNINVIFNKFEHPLYTQTHVSSGPFIEGLSCLDMLFNLGCREACRVFSKNLKNEDEK